MHIISWMCSNVQMSQTRLEEWDQFRHWRLLSADLYLLVYDVMSQSSFNFIKILRESLLSARPGEAEFIVVANKGIAYGG